MDYSRVSETWAAAADRTVLSQRFERWSASQWVLNAQASVTAVPRNAASAFRFSRTHAGVRSVLLVVFAIMTFAVLDARLRVAIRRVPRVSASTPRSRLA
jgi:hypothetical protein